MVSANSPDEQRKREVRKFQNKQKPKMTLGEKILAKENKQKKLFGN